MVHWVWANLKDRQQRVRINHHYSEWKHVIGGVPQGSWLGPVLFIIVIDDLDVDDVDVLKFMDDTTVTEVVGKASDSKMQRHLHQVELWSRENYMILNPRKTKEICINFRHTPNPPLLKTSDDHEIERVASSKHLGVTVQCNLKWSDHIDELVTKASKRINFLLAIKRCKCTEQDLVHYYIASIRSVLEYAAVVFHAGLTKQQCDDLESIQRRTLRVIFPQKTYDEALVDGKLQTLETRRCEACKDLFTKMQNSEHRLHKLLPEPCIKNYELRSRQRYSTCNVATNRQCSEFINVCLANVNSI